MTSLVLLSLPWGVWLAALSHCSAALAVVAGCITLGAMALILSQIFLLPEIEHHLVGEAAPAFEVDDTELRQVFNGVLHRQTPLADITACRVRCVGQNVTDIAVWAKASDVLKLNSTCYSVGALGLLHRALASRLGDDGRVVVRKAWFSTTQIGGLIGCGAIAFVGYLVACVLESFVDGRWN